VRFRGEGGKKREPFADVRQSIIATGRGPLLQRAIDQVRYTNANFTGKTPLYILALFNAKAQRLRLH